MTHKIIMSSREFEKKLNDGMELTYRRLIEQKRKTNTPLIHSENGVVQFVDPYTVQL